MQPGDQTPSGSTCLWRLTKPDGSTLEITWHASGALGATATAPNRAIVESVDFAIDDTGTPTLVRTRRGALVANDVMKRTANPYGVVVEAVDGGLLGHVDYRFDDEGRCYEVSVQGAWGSEKIELHPDGGRTLTWKTALHHGTAVWDAAGRQRRFDAHSIGDGIEAAITT